MNNYFLDTICVDLGYPDPGHDEYVLCRKDKRKNKILQKLLGDKKTKILWYGERKPSQSEVDNDIKKYHEKHMSTIRDSKLQEMGI